MFGRTAGDRGDIWWPKCARNHRGNSVTENKQHARRTAEPGGRGGARASARALIQSCLKPYKTDGKPTKARYFRNKNLACLLLNRSKLGRKLNPIPLRVGGRRTSASTTNQRNHQLSVLESYQTHDSKEAIHRPTAKIPTDGRTRCLHYRSLSLSLWWARSEERVRLHQLGHLPLLGRATRRAR